MKNMLTLEFVRYCPGKGDPGEEITMPVEEYIALSANTHPTNLFLAGPNKGKPKFLDPRLNHTVVVEGQDILDARLKEIADKEAEEKTPAKKAPAKMDIEECQAELKEKEIEFDEDANVTALRKLVVGGRK